MGDNGKIRVEWQDAPTAQYGVIPNPPKHSAEEWDERTRAKLHRPLHLLLSGERIKGWDLNGKEIDLTWREEVGVRRVFTLSKNTVEYRRAINASGTSSGVVVVLTAARYAEIAMTFNEGGVIPRNAPTDGNSRAFVYELARFLAYQDSLV